jgi:DNA repair protein RadC
LSTKPDTPLDRFRALGANAASPTDLIALGLSRRVDDTTPNEPIARDLLRRLENVRALTELSPADLAELGLDLFEASRFLALLELGRRAEKAGKGEVTAIDGPEDVFRICTDLRHQKKEYFVALLLDTQNGVMRRATIHVGTLTASLVGAREVFREAVRDGASSIIVAHNHPSGDPQPSPEDVQVTRQLLLAGDVLDIPVLDHVVIGDREFRSLKRMGLMG